MRRKRGHWRRKPVHRGVIALVAAECIGIPIVIVIALTNQDLLAQFNRLNVVLFGALCAWLPIYLFLANLVHTEFVEPDPEPSTSWDTGLGFGCGHVIVLLFGILILFASCSASPQSFLRGRVSDIAFFTPTIVFAAGYLFSMTLRDLARGLLRRNRSHTGLRHELQGGPSMRHDSPSSPGDPNRHIQPPRAGGRRRRARRKH